MFRTVSGVCALSSGDTLELELCDKYMRSLDIEKISVSVGEDGDFSVDLSINEDDTCWVALTAGAKRAFWVYEGEGVLSVDLLHHIYPLPGLPTLGEASAASVLNAKRIVAHIAYGCPVVVKEEESLCSSLEQDELYDKRVCDIDRKIME